MPDVKPNTILMNLYTKIKFWSLPVVGVVCIFIGGYLYPFGPEKRPWSEFLLLAGVGQLLIFAVLLFFWYRRKNKQAEKA
jgi:hypothetical protein